MRGLPGYHALVVIAKANLWVCDYVHLIYKTGRHHIYNQLGHPMQTHNMGKVDNRISLVVGEEELSEIIVQQWMTTQRSFIKAQRVSKLGQKRTQMLKMQPSLTYEVDLS